MKYEIKYKASDENLQAFEERTINFFKKIYPDTEVEAIHGKNRNILKFHVSLGEGFSKLTKTYLLILDEKIIIKTYKVTEEKLTKAELEYFDKAGFQLDNRHMIMFNQHIEDWWGMKDE